MDVWGAGNFEVMLIVYSTMDRYLYFSDYTGQGFLCGANLGTRADVILRAQKDSNGYRSLSVWDSEGALTVTCWDGSTSSSTQAPRPGPDNLGGVIIGANIYGAYPYQSAMAYFRLF